MEQELCSLCEHPYLLPVCTEVRAAQSLVSLVGRAEGLRSLPSQKNVYTLFKNPFIGGIFGHGKFVFFQILPKVLENCRVKLLFFHLSGQFVFSLIFCDRKVKWSFH
jgi:hypothetical protein